MDRIGFMMMLFVAVLCFAAPVGAAGVDEGGGQADQAAEAGDFGGEEQVGPDRESPVLPGVVLAESLSATTGVAISPLLGVAALGALDYWRADSEGRANLPWHASPWFWFPAFLIVGVLAFKDPLSGLLPFADKPLDLVEIVENKLSAVVAAPVLVGLIQRVYESGSSQVPDGVSLGGLDLPGWVAGGFLAVSLTVVFAVVWLMSQAVNILILLSPSAFFDVALRLVRGVAFGAVALTALINPWLGLVVVVPVIWLAFRCSGWAWRLVVYGSTLAWDWIGRREGSAVPGGRVRAFLEGGGWGMPRRTRGYLELDASEGLVFRGRPWPWCRVRTVPAVGMRRYIGRGFPGPTVFVEKGGTLVAFAFMPPRFRGREEGVSGALGLDGVRDGLFQRNWRSFVSWFRGGAAPEAVGGARQ